MCLRFVALRAAVRKFPTGASAAALPALAPKEAALPAPGSRRARLPRGALAEAAMGASGNASEESEPEPEQLPPARKITRQQRAASEPSICVPCGYGKPEYRVNRGGLPPSGAVQCAPSRTMSGVKPQFVCALSSCKGDDASLQ